MTKITKQIPYACPVCKGKGELGADLAQFHVKPKYVGQPIYSCHVCSGSCLIWEIREEEAEPNFGGVQPITLPPMQPFTQPPLNPPIWITGVSPGVGVGQRFGTGDIYKPEDYKMYNTNEYTIENGEITYETNHNN